MNSPLTLKVTSSLSDKVCSLLLSKLCKLTKELRKQANMKSRQLDVVFENLRVSPYQFGIGEIFESQSSLFAYDSISKSPRKSLILKAMPIMIVQMSFVQPGYCVLWNPIVFSRHVSLKRSVTQSL
jgi:hypothetical protein